MPAYDYKCPTCGIVVEQIHSIKESPLIPCPECEKVGSTVIMERMISLNTSGFIFKSWTEPMSYKASRQKQSSIADMEARQIERYGSGPRLQPNVAGLETSSWGEAQSLAKEAGLNTSSYDSHIEKEKHVSKSSGVDDRKWKKVKDLKI